MASAEYARRQEVLKELEFFQHIIIFLADESGEGSSMIQLFANYGIYEKARIYFYKKDNNERYEQFVAFLKIFNQLAVLPKEILAWLFDKEYLLGDTFVFEVVDASLNQTEPRSAVFVRSLEDGTTDFYRVC